MSFIDMAVVGFAVIAVNGSAIGGNSDVCEALGGLVVVERVETVVDYVEATVERPLTDATVVTTDECVVTVEVVLVVRGFLCFVGLFG
jgi:hypothetical protein